MMQNMIVADNHMASVENGTKTIAVRVGYCTVKPGPLEIRSASGCWPTTRVHVVSVQRKSISALSSDELSQSGFSNVNTLVKQLQPAHPCLSTDSDVTVINWKVAS
jgi:hypothetical protein